MIRIGPEGGKEWRANERTSPTAQSKERCWFEDERPVGLNSTCTSSLSTATNGTETKATHRRPIQHTARGQPPAFCYRSLFLPKHCSTQPYRLVSEAGKNKGIVSYTVMRDTKLVYRTCVVVNCHQSCPSLPTIKQYCLSNCNTKRGKKRQQFHPSNYHTSSSVVTCQSPRIERHVGWSLEIA